VRVGLTLGKYAPLHRGHQLVIETGLGEVDEMVVLVYDAPETNIPLGVRSAWLRALYPSVRVIEAWDGPTQVGYTPELMSSHERYVTDTLGVRGITHFYCSEPYGEHMSRALGALDRRVDEAREKIPVSAAAIRKEPFKYIEYMHPSVYRDLVTNVVFMGAPSSGKTSLAERLAGEFDTKWMPEYGREYWERHQVGRRLTLEQLVELAEEHVQREDALLEKANRFLFTDTNAITTATFARYYHGSIGPRLEALADAAVTRYDLVFLCDIDIPYDDTWDRSGQANRTAFQRQVIGDLKMRKVPFFLLRGTLEERVSRVRKVLQGFTKYTNVVEILGGALE
jgi:HTH-type transcriptional regulator, transcriptional repressor of NAD biosynthesis genes